MIKIVSPSSWDWDAPVAKLVDCHSNGVDSSWLIKRAAAGVFKDFDGLTAKPNHSLIHLIALGDAETYAGNKNGDIFYKTARKLDLADPDWDKILTDKGYITKSAETFKDHTDVGNQECANTFTKFGHVFKNHKNRPSQGHKIYGEIKAAAHNDQMDRVELIIEVPHGKDWDDDLEKIANEEPIPWSMAARVPFDICNVCGHASPTRGHYCDHLKNHMSEMLKTGHVVGAVNDHMAFFDISRVIRPADRIAWSLTKVASEDRTVGGAELAEAYEIYPSLDVLTSSVSSKLSKKAELFRKAAEIEKQIPVQAKYFKNKASGIKPSRNMTKECSQLRGSSSYQLPVAYKALADAGVCLSFNDWAYLTLGEDVYTKKAGFISETEEVLSNAFSLAIDRFEQITSNSAYTPSYSYPSASMRKLASEMAIVGGLAPEHVKSRAIHNVISDEPVMLKKASAKSSLSIEANCLLDNYLAYKLAFLEAVEKAEPQLIDHFIEACITQNCL